MRVIVCGGRTFDDAAFLNRTLDELHAAQPITLVIHGMARGADSLGAAWAKKNKIPVQGYPAEWRRYGNRAAGPIRNKRMLVEGWPDRVIAFPGGNGTADMIRQARVAGVPVLKIAA